ncbi:MAG: M23 family metallopeptidase [Pseudomonadota bacterium]
MRLVFVSAIAACCLAACVTPPPASPSYPTIASSGDFRPDRSMMICRGFRATNAPPSDARGRLSSYTPYVNYNNRVILALKPVNGGCLSSGFGPRGRSRHEGIDISAATGTPIYSGAKGVISEAQWRSGYGYQIVVDHGWGLYTRYAHMNDFAPGIRVGTPVDAGALIGYVGSSGNATGAHLHYEVLTGNIRRGRGSIDLKARDPFSLPPYQRSVS